MTERLQKVSAALLLIRMENISEDWYCAGWLHGLEYMLWEIVKAGGAKPGMTKEECDEFLQLAHDAGGWYEFDSKLTPLPEWEAKFAEWSRTEDSKQAKDNQGRSGFSR